jgi:hypothetical protein
MPEGVLGVAADLLSAVASAPPMPGFDLTGAGRVRRVSP